MPAGRVANISGDGESGHGDRVLYISGLTAVPPSSAVSTWDPKRVLSTLVRVLIDGETVVAEVEVVSNEVDDVVVDSDVVEMFEVADWADLAEDTEVFFLALLELKSKSGSTSESAIASAVWSMAGSVWEDVRPGAAFNACSLPVGSCFTCPAKSGSGKGVKGRSFFRLRFSGVRWKSRSTTCDDATLYWLAKELGDLSPRECKCRRRACATGNGF